MYICLVSKVLKRENSDAEAGTSFDLKVEFSYFIFWTFDKQMVSNNKCSQISCSHV